MKLCKQSIQNIPWALTRKKMEIEKWYITAVVQSDEDTNT
jgi:hypothetical protein